MSDKTSIVWPINPNDSNADIDKNISNFLKRLSKVLDFSIKPVCVLSSEFFTTSEYFQPIDMNIIKDSLKNDCEEYLEKFDFYFEDLTILENFYGSKRGEVAIFSQFVEETKPDFVVVGSHGRKGWSRTILGSFTENLLLKTRAPVFVIGPECKNEGDLGKALMPIEISKATHGFLEDFLAYKSLSFLESVKLFHKISMIDLENIAWSASIYGVVGVATYDVREQAKKETINKLNAILEKSSEQNRVAYEISESLDSLSSVITQVAQKGDTGLIIMRSESGFWATNVLGSVTRQVIREAKSPVLVYPHSYEKS